ncbi:TonB-dependent receptor [Chitinophaga sp. XS-30]|nr:TonB-dependent receptor [Chitinophaga sp. XS-30]
MKFYLQTSIDWRKIMRITISQLFLSVMLTGVVCAESGKAQSVLNRPVDMSLRQLRLQDALDALEKKADVKFVYSKSIIETGQLVVIRAQQDKLSAVLDRLLTPIGISYAVVDDRIVLNRARDAIRSVPEILRELPSKVTETPEPRLTVTGRVTTAAGEPLTGVTVKLKGTNVGTATDEDGRYALTLPDEGGILEFSFIGFTTQEAAVEGRRVINITMSESNDSLDEVVVVAYGTQKKATMTGAVSAINAKELKTSTQSNLTNMLAGKLPGLRVVQRTSEPGNYESYFDIRGMGSPLIVVDGVVRTDFNKIDPNEIESISVLKDASAAIYGVKSANGVILVTTKKGLAGKTEISYSGVYGWANVTSTPEVGNAVDWMTLTNENVQLNNIINNRSDALPFSDADINEYASGAKQSTDWQGLALQEFAPQQQHNLNLRGGTEKTKYFVSLGYFDEMGIWKSGDLNYKRYNFRSNLSVQIRKDLEAELHVDGIFDEKNEPGGTQDRVLMFKSMWMQIPTLSVYANDNPEYLNAAVADGTHPLAITSTAMSGYIRTQNRAFQGSFALNYTPEYLPGLRARFLYSHYNLARNVKTYKKKYPLYTYDQVNDTYTPTYMQSPSYLRQEYGLNYKHLVQTSLNYERNFNKHGVKGLLMYELRTDAGDNFAARRDLVLEVDQLYAGDPSTQQATANAGAIIDDANLGLIGRLNYDYDGRYLLEYAFRYDGSSKFMAGSRWGFFPSVSAGWRISEEKFFRDNITFVDNLKLRASWGKMGDDAASSFQFVDGFSYPSGYYYFNNGLVSGLGFQRLPNYHLTWFEATTTDIGLEGSLWKNKLRFEFDVFQRHRTGLLATRNLTLPGTVGAGLPQENLNSDLTRGYELTLGHSGKIRDVQLSITGNVAYARTKNRYIERALPGNAYDNWRGNPNERWNNIIWGYRVIGRFQTMDEIYNAPVQDGNGNRYLLPGDLKYLDVNNDGVIDSGDETPIGRGTTATSGYASPNRFPEYTFGLTLNAGYKGFDLSILMQGAANFDVIYGGALQTPLRWGRNSLAIFNDRWHLADMNDKNSEWVPGKYPAYRTTTNSNYKVSDFWLQDASFLRLKSVEAGYTFPQRILGRTGIRNLRVYVNGFNLHTWTKIKFIDPEQTPQDNSSLYPITRNFNFGVNISL